ncbi:MAG: L,D-transpeptidase [Pseudomonadota bacterium]|nr:L,D-transpeptidase [Pseudomonadota bacterium]
MRRTYLLAALLALAALDCTATPFWGAKHSAPADTPIEALKPGEFIWEGELEPRGPVVVIVSLPEQMGYVYRNGVRIAVTTVSTGKKGHRTPTGVFTILNKDKHHRSKTYGNAPMPYSERLTWDGVALHAGGLPGYPSSHGCIHLPSELARLLFGITHKGTTVVIADESTAPRSVVHPAVLTPVDADTGTPEPHHALGFSQDYRWEPDASPAGPLTLVASAADERVIVLRNGVEIGRARIAIDNPGKPLGTHAYTVLAGGDSQHPRWSTVGLPGHAAESAGTQDLDAVDRLLMPQTLTSRLYPLLEPGTTMLVTDAPILEHTTGPSLYVMSSGIPGSETIAESKELAERQVPAPVESVRIN